MPTFPVWFLFASASAILSAAAAILQKKALVRVDALEFSFVLSCAVLTLSLFVPFVTDVTALSSTALVFLLIKSIMGGVGFLLVMMSLERNPITSALPLLGMTPAVTAVFGIVVLGEHLQGVEWIGLALMMAGTFILEQGPGPSLTAAWSSFFRSRKHLPVFGALVLFASSSIIDRLLLTGHRTDPRVVMFYQHIVYVVIFWGMLAMRRSSTITVLCAARTYAGPIVLIALVTIGYRFAQLEATKLAPVALVLAVKRTSILYASVVGGNLFSEEGLAKKIVAAALIVGAGFLMLRQLAG
jgi:uncharacterized membrane protein